MFGEDYQNLVVVIQDLLNEVVNRLCFESIETNSCSTGS